MEFICDCTRNMTRKQRAKRELGLQIADHGGWEEFHQKQDNWTMFDYHKSRRLKLLAKYKKMPS